MDDEEERAAEVEALEAIFGDEYDPDESLGGFHITIDAEEASKSGRDAARLWVKFGSNYPTSPPEELKLRHSHLLQPVADAIEGRIRETAAEFAGTACVYNLVDTAKQALEDHAAMVVTSKLSEVSISSQPSAPSDGTPVPPKPSDAVPLTKRAKRRAFDAQIKEGRGSDWVDVLQHLHKTGEQTTMN